MQLNADDLAAMDRRYRATLINTISGFKPANLVGTASPQGNSNLAIMSSVVHLGSRPPLIAFVVRPEPVDRHTLDNILETGCYTINHVAESFIEAAHQTAARYARNISEFEATGLTPDWHPGFPAPFVRESRVRMGLRLREHQELAVNGTHFVIGEVVLLDLPGEYVDEAGRLDLAGAGSVALSGLDTYHAVTPLKTMAYAKPDLPPRTLSPPRT